MRQDRFPVTLLDAHSAHSKFYALSRRKRNKLTEAIFSETSFVCATRHGSSFFIVWEVKFHKSHPDNLFSCSEDGSVWHWDGSNINTPAMAVGQGKGLYNWKPKF